MGSGSYRLTSYWIFEFEKTLRQSRGSWRLCRTEVVSDEKNPSRGSEKLFVDVRC
jgi:hypothetical protein